MSQEAALMLHPNKKMLVKVKFKHRIFHRHRLTNRISCPKDRRERLVGNISFDQCKKPCEFAVKIEEKGVWCSYGQKQE